MKKFFNDIGLYLTGNLFIYQDAVGDLYKVYYDYNTEWNMHVFTCPALDYSSTVVSDGFTKSMAWFVVRKRMRGGLS